ncbi:MAG TPA: toll/interleukin-1 receptor domain-containing protein [Accumulibacter sp.]|uniref:toll/interleukin-1 receptor domain-containing protein n=1 Tax=Accumulibacter sp. TaxID=2053492 RepID=UPI00260D775E|nr:toll/interleukin-1 receptor domain-containing protein [Accumulibacter sp.]MDS4055955.1 toll/interleukin-1 receptor domain-containing protein [Accumulibacter sp.]HMV05927.1 toll/interleukin-1 receptor domain-containing protein [Accumulibacter sp.]HMW64596.1 toll/interleukin-1 receptor domain-containing protein [Accumulibacter sp.]HMW81279.1 toll/interleukin-1 receptor domain-containing protein [Accumulibacter sp.]HMX69547.1 toll/interleukin-1 receptor domain-containing protein [Accumulibacte
MSDKVFLSYAAQDRHFAEALKPQISELLQKHAQTLDVFDAHALASGEDFRKTVKDAMDAATAVVIVASPAGEASQWVNYEAGLADALGKDVVLVGRKGTTASSAFGRLLESARFVEVDDEAA